MSDIPDWAINVPSAPGIHNPPEQIDGEWTRPFSVAQLIEIGLELMEQFLRRVVQAVMGFFPGGAAAFELLSEWADKLFERLQGIASIFGLNSIDDLLGLLNPLNVWQNIVEVFIDPLDFFAKIVDIVSALTGFVAGDLEDLAAWASNLPLIGDIVQAITGVFGGGLPDLAAWASNVPVLGDIFRVVAEFVNAILPGNLFGGLIPISGLTDEQPNLLVNPLFTAEAIADNPDWSVDASVSASGDGSGAARVVADGSVKGLRSNLVGVTEGQQVSLSVKARSSGLTGGGSPIRLGLVAFRGGVQQSVITLDSTGGGSSWVELSGEWTVPAGVDQFCARLVVAGSATSGTVWFDEGVVRRTSNQIQRSWVDGLVDILGGIASLFGLGFIEDLLEGFNVADIWSNIVEAIINPLGLIEDLVARLGLQDLIDGIIEALTGLPVVGGLIGTVISELSDLFGVANDAFANADDALGGLGDLLNDLLTNPAAVLGQIPQTLVSGLEGILSGLTSSLNGVISQVTTLANNLISAPASVIGGIIDLVIDGVSTIGDFLNSLWSGFNRTFSAPPEQMSAEQVAHAAYQVADTSVAAGSTADTISSFLATPRELPAWIGDLSDDVAFAKEFIDGSSSPGLGSLRLVPIKVLQDRTYQSVKFGVAGDTFTNLFVGLYWVDQETGDCIKVVDFGNVKPDLDTGYHMQSIDLAEPIGVQRGELYYVGLLQTGGTSAAMHRWSSSTNFFTGLWPQYLGLVVNGSFSSLPSNISDGNITSGTKYWAALGDPIDPLIPPPPPKLSYSDTFNRANSSNLGGAWSLKSGWHPRIYSNAVSSESQTRPGLVGYISRLTTTEQRAKMVLRDSQFPGSSDSETQGTLFVRGNGSGRSVTLRVAKYWEDLSEFILGVRWGIYTNTTYQQARNGTGTLRLWNNVVAPPQQPTVAEQWFVGTWEIAAESNVYTVYRNGAQMLQWTDSGNAFSYGVNNTEVGMGVTTRETYHPAIDSWQAWDI